MADRLKCVIALAAAIVLAGCSNQLRSVSVHNSLAFPITVKVDRFKYSVTIAPGASQTFPDKFYVGGSVSVQAFRADTGKRIFKNTFGGKALAQIDDGERVAVEIK